MANEKVTRLSVSSGKFLQAPAAGAVVVPENRPNAGAVDAVVAVGANENVGAVVGLAVANPNDDVPDVAAALAAGNNDEPPPIQKGHFTAPKRYSSVRLYQKRRQALLSS